MHKRLHVTRNIVFIILIHIAAICRGEQDAPPSAPSQPQQSQPVINTAAAILALPAEQAGMRLPVSMRGVVTAAEPDWRGQFFVQDETGGVFVENYDAPPPRPGDLIEIAGVSHPGAFAPIISQPHWVTTGTAALPEPQTISVENLMAGAADGLRVEITGIVRATHTEAGRLVLELAINKQRMQAQVHAPPGLNADALLGAHVSVRGTAASHYNAAVRHLTSVAVYAVLLGDFSVLETEPVDPFTRPTIPVNSVAQYHRGININRRVHVSGIVTCQRLGEDVFIQDNSGGIRLQTGRAQVFKPGQPVEAVGWLEYEDYLPYLRDAVVKTTDTSASSPPKPATVNARELRDNIHNGERVLLCGRIIGMSARPLARVDAADAPRTLVTWLLQTDDAVVPVEYETPSRTPDLGVTPAGSTVEVSGVCVAAIDANGKLLSARLLLQSDADMRVLDRPSWLTPARLRVGIAILAGVLIVLACWLLSARRKNAALHTLVSKLEQTRGELQKAHDTLEQKVAERTAQLQVEMSARKTDELEFKATLAERTRLARDLHDTHEQTLTGIALQLDTAAKLASRSPESSSMHLQLARNWMRQAQLELRRSIWDLRSRELEQFDLAGALRRSAEHLADAGGIHCDFQIKGQPCELPEIVEENILRIGQEALTNIARHARATRAAVTLETTPRSLILCVEDNGAGFDPEQVRRAGEGHFGLTGMAERAKRMGGELRLDSAPGRGTAIQVEVPLRAPAI